MIIYHQLTQEFNRGRARAILCGSQAVLMHRLAITSKDGDWIIRESADDLDHIRRIANIDAQLRFSRSVRDLGELAIANPDATSRIAAIRPLLCKTSPLNMSDCGRLPISET